MVWWQEFDSRRDGVDLRTAVVAALVSFAMPAIAQNHAAGSQIAFAREQHLKRGINASGWFAQSSDYTAAHTSRYTDQRDIALMARLGFDHVRLSIDPVPLTQDPLGTDGLNDEFVARLDQAVNTILGDGLAVIIDLQPADSYKQQLWKGDSGGKQLSALWRKLAAHYAGRDPDRVFFEILNEPEVKAPHRWAQIQEHVAQAIREVAPHNTIIATGANYANLQDLLAAEPLADRNVIYNFHFYEPHEFTHQGANWGLAWWSYTHSIPYPATENSMRGLLKEVPDLADRYELENYFLDSWNARHIRALIDEAAAWARENHVPLICDEFGVYREHSDPVSRANWIRDTRSALEADGIGWAMWDYRGGFGVVTKQDGQPAQVDDAVVKALGLSGR